MIFAATVSINEIKRLYMNSLFVDDEPLFWIWSAKISNQRILSCYCSCHIRQKLRSLHKITVWNVSKTVVNDQWRCEFLNNQPCSGNLCCDCLAWVFLLLPFDCQHVFNHYQSWLRLWTNLSAVAVSRLLYNMARWNPLYWRIQLGSQYHEKTQASD